MHPLFKTTFYHFLALFAISFSSIHGTSSTTEKLDNVIGIITSNSTLKEKIKALNKIATENIGVNQTSEYYEKTLLVTIITSEAINFKEKVFLITQLCHIANKKNEILDINAGFFLPILAIMENKKINFKERIQLINQLLQIAKDTGNTININKGGGGSPISAIIENEKINFKEKIDLIAFLGKIAKKTSQTVDINKGSPIKGILVSPLSFNEQMQLMELLINIVDSTKKTKAVKIESRDTLLSVILQNENLDATRQIKAIKTLRKFGSLALTHKDDIMYLLHVITTINKSTDNNSKAKLIEEVMNNQFNLNSYRLLKIILTYDEYASSYYIELIKKLVNIMPADWFKFEESQNPITLIEATLANKRLDASDQVKLIEQLYKWPCLDDTIILNYQIRKEIKKLFKTLKLKKEERKMLAKLTGLKPNLITRDRYYTQENKKTTTFTLLAILGTIIYGIWQHVKSNIKINQENISVDHD